MKKLNPIETAVINDRKRTADVIDARITKLQTELNKVYEDNKTGSSDKWYDARHAYDLLADFKYDMQVIANKLKQTE